MNRFLKCYFFLKKYFMSFCTFFTTFTIVMTILILATDLNERRHYFEFNITNVWEFENFPQNSPKLVQLIRREFIHAPQVFEKKTTNINLNNFVVDKNIYRYFNKKKNGIFVECGAGNMNISSSTDWLEVKKSWKGLLTQPHPYDFLNLATRRKNSHSANVCISPTSYPTHAEFKSSSTDINETSSLTTIPCFPLFSILLAFNATSLDLLVFNLMSAEYQILKTLPFNYVHIGVLNIINYEEDVCCDKNLLNFLNNHGYRQATPCPTEQSSCFFVCTFLKYNCPYI